MFVVGHKLLLALPPPPFICLPSRGEKECLRQYQSYIFGPKHLQNQVLMDSVLI